MNFTTTLLPPNTTICLINCTQNKSNGTEQPATNEAELLIVTIILPFILLACLFGNTLLIVSIVKFRQLRRIESNYFILNLAICDLITTGFGIPVSLVIYHVTSFPFGEIGCKMLWPVATYGVNAAALTLISIAIERFTVICSINFKLTIRKILCMILFIHISSICSIIPYSVHLTYEQHEGVNYCYEDWIGSAEQKRYTISLFLLQYGIPLITMIVLYSIAWYKIFKQNQKMIKMSEEYERKMHWDESDCAAKNNERKTTTVSFDRDSNKSVTSLSTDVKEDSRLISPGQNPVFTITTHTEAKLAITHTLTVDENDNTDHSSTAENTQPIIELHHASKKTHFKRTFQRSNTLQSIRKTIHKFRKPDYVSQTAYVRHKQTVTTLTMFTIIVIVFLILALPNQIIWLMKDFVPKQVINVYLSTVFQLITYVNPVVNCWIYAGFNKGFMKAYKQILKKIITCGQYEEDFLDRDTIFSTINKTETSYYDSEQKQMFEDRSNVFTKMFQQHYDNFDQFKHLYHFEDEEYETLLEQPTPSKRKRKITLANVMNVITQGRRSSVSTKPNKPGRFGLIPPIVPFVQQSGVPRHTDRKISSSSLVEMRPRKSSRDKLSRSNTLRVPGSNVEERHRRASTPARHTDINYCIDTPRKRSGTQPSEYKVDNKNNRNSWKDLLTPKVFRKQVVKQKIETETPVSVITAEYELPNKDDINVQEVNTVEETVFQVKKQTNLKKVIMKNPLNMKRRKSTPTRPSNLPMQINQLSNIHPIKSSPGQAISSPIESGSVNEIKPVKLHSVTSIEPKYVNTVKTLCTSQRPKQLNIAATPIIYDDEKVNSPTMSTMRTPTEIKAIALNPMEMIVEEHCDVQVCAGVAKVNKPKVYTVQPLKVERSHINKECECKTILQNNGITPSCSHVDENSQFARRSSIKILNSSKLVAKNKALFNSKSLDFPTDIVSRKAILKQTRGHENSKSFDSSSMNRRKNAVFIHPDYVELSKKPTTSIKEEAELPTRFKRKTSLSAHVNANLS